MCLKETCNKPRMLRTGIALILTLILVTLYLKRLQRSVISELRFHPGKSTTTSHNIHRQHILKFYNPEKNMTLTKTSVRIGQGLKYGSAYGQKKSKSFKVTEDFLKLIPEESPLKDRHFNTCAVVGNSGILLNSSCGQEIDSMDFVIRCNLPQIEGYEKDVGSKANFTTMNPSVVKNNFGQWNNKTHTDYDRLLERLKQVGDQILYVPVLTSAFGEKYARVIIQIILLNNLSMKTAFPPAGINKLMNKIWTEAGYKIVALRPSTGAHMYTLAATICDQIHMYGFYPFSEDTRGRTLRHHYYDTKEEISHTANRTHNMPEEFRAFQKLHMRGALVLHTEPCHFISVKEFFQVFQKLLVVK